MCAPRSVLASAMRAKSIPPPPGSTAVGVSQLQDTEPCEVYVPLAISKRQNQVLNRILRVAHPARRFFEASFVK